MPKKAKNTDCLIAFEHVCVDKTDKKNHIPIRVNLIIEGEPVPEKVICPRCGLEIVKGLVTKGFYIK